MIGPAKFPRPLPGGEPRPVPPVSGPFQDPALGEFQAKDTNNDNALSKDEFVLERRLGIPGGVLKQTPEAIKEKEAAFKRYDRDGDEKLSLPEFIAGRAGDRLFKLLEFMSQLPGKFPRPGGINPPPYGPIDGGLPKPPTKGPLEGGLPEPVPAEGRSPYQAGGLTLDDLKGLKPDQK